MIKIVNTEDSERVHKDTFRYMETNAERVARQAAEERADLEVACDLLGVQAPPNSTAAIPKTQPISDKKKKTVAVVTVPKRKKQNKHPRVHVDDY
jgi:hypothetical protein